MISSQWDPLADVLMTGQRRTRMEAERPIRDHRWGDRSLDQDRGRAGPRSAGS